MALDRQDDGKLDERYDAFLCHGSGDKPFVRELAQRLTEEGLRVWFDEWIIRPGDEFLPAMERGILGSKVGLVLIGPHASGIWVLREMRSIVQLATQGVLRVIPVLLPGLDTKPELPLFLSAHVVLDLRSGLGTPDVARLVSAIRDEDGGPAQRVSGRPAPAPTRLYGVPPIPAEYQERPEFEQLRARLTTPGGPRLAIEGRVMRVGLQGMGGVGKTVLATALARDEQVQGFFPDGVFWITLGQSCSPERLLALQMRWLDDLEAHTAGLSSVEAGKHALEKALRDKACLVVLDDVWETAHALAFDAVGQQSKLLITTRKNEISRRLGAQAFPLDVLPPEEAMDLLANYVALPRAELPGIAESLVRETGFLPMAIAMVGSMIRARPNDWGFVLRKLQKADLARITGEFPGYAHPSLLAALEASLEDLPEATRQRYLELAVFREDVSIPERALVAVWSSAGIDADEVHDLVHLLADRNLVRRDTCDGISLHDLHHDYVRTKCADVGRVHGNLVAAYQELAPAGLHGGPDDGYFFDHIAEHLCSAGKEQTLRALLLDARWLLAKLRATQKRAAAEGSRGSAWSLTQGLLTDFSLLGLETDEPLQLLRDTLRLAAPILDQRLEELCAQLTGRLLTCSGSDIERFLHSMGSDRPWLCPRWAVLIAARGMLLGRVDGHREDVRALALTADGKRAISASSEAVKKWDLERGVELASLRLKLEHVRALAVSDNAARVAWVSGQVLTVWDLQRNALLHELSREPAWATAIALNADGSRALTASSDGKLRLWDLISGECLRVTDGWAGGQYTLAMSGDGTRWAASAIYTTMSIRVWKESGLTRLRAAHGVHALSMNADGTRLVAVYSGGLAVWNTDTGQSLYEFRTPLDDLEDWGHQAAMSADGKRVISASSDGTLTLFDVEAGVLLGAMRRHPTSITAVALNPDGSRALSASRGMLALWNANAIGSAEPIDQGGRFRAIAGIRRGTALVTATDDGLEILDAFSRSRLLSLERSQSGILPLSVDAEGGQIAAAFSDGTVKLWDEASGSLLRTLPNTNKRIVSIAFQLGQGRLILACRDGEMISHPLDPAPEGTPSSKRLLRDAQARLPLLQRLVERAVGGINQSDDNVYVDLDTHLKGFGGQYQQVSALRLCSDGSRAVSGSDDTTVKLWDLTSGTCLRTMRGHLGSVEAVAVDAAGHWILSGSTDTTIKVWKLDTGELIHTLTGHRDTVTSVAANQSGQRAVSVSRDRTIRVWNLTTGTELATFTADAAFDVVALCGEDRVYAGDSLGHLHFLELRQPDVPSSGSRTEPVRTQRS